MNGNIANSFEKCDDSFSDNKLSTGIKRGMFFISATLCCLFTACGFNQNPTALQEIPADLHGSGATFPDPLYQAWIEKYHTIADIKIQYQSVGSGQGVKDFLADVNDFGASDAPLKETEFPQAPRGIQHIPTTAGMITIAYNLKGVEDLKLTREVYAEIFLGEITQWNDPKITAINPKLNLPKQDIAVIAREDSSGTTYAFTKHLSLISPQWEKQYGAFKVIDWPGTTRVAQGNAGVAGTIKLTHGSIGYVEFGEASRAKLAFAHLQNRHAFENKTDSFIEPTLQSGQAALANAKLSAPDFISNMDGPDAWRDPRGEASYPIVTYTWMLLPTQPKDAKKYDQLKAFVAWCLQDGQDVNEKLGFIKLSPEIATEVLERVQQLPQNNTR